jgi:hypothetical protein
LLIIYEAKPRQPAKIHSAGKFLLKTWKAFLFMQMVCLKLFE